MKLKDKMNRKKSVMDGITRTAMVMGAILGVISGALVVIQGADAYIRSHEQPDITIKNRLYLPIMIVVNDSSAYTYRVEADSQKTITLLSDYDFPAKMRWYVIRNENAAGKEIGEVLAGDYLKIDKGKKINITNTSGADVYFYPVIYNNTDEKCLIVINDELIIEYVIGVSNPHRKTNITGYFKYAKNSNVTLYCNGKPYWHGVRNGQSSVDKLPIQSGSGVTEISFP